MSRSAWSAVLTALLIVSLVALCGCKKGDKEEQTTASGTQAPAAKATPGPATSGPAGKAAAKATEAPGPAPELTAGPPKATARKAPAAAPGETKPAEFPKLTRRIIARPNVKSPLRKDLSPEEAFGRGPDRARARAGQRADGQAAEPGRRERGPDPGHIGLLAGAYGCGGPEPRDTAGRAAGALPGV